MKKDKDSKKDKEAQGEKLQGFEIKVDEFGNIITNMDTDSINRFLDENLEDVKLKEREEKKKKDGDA